MVKNIPLDSLQQQHAIAMRKYVMRYLLSVAKPPARQRTCCDAIDCKEPSEQSVCWISCDVCGRWLHFICIGLTRAPRSTYVSVICRAQYDWSLCVCSWPDFLILVPVSTRHRSFTVTFTFAMYSILCIVDLRSVMLLLNEDANMVGCDMCRRWFHFSCIGLRRAPAKRQWHCECCKHN